MALHQVELPENSGRGRSSDLTSRVAASRALPVPVTESRRNMRLGLELHCSLHTTITTLTSLPPLIRRLSLL